MGKEMIMCQKIFLAIILMLSVFPLEIKSENLGCSFQGLQLDRCLNQNGEFIFLEPCCRALNLALRAGFHCLCSVLVTDTSQFAALFSWSMTSFYLSVPPLPMCRDLGAMPIALPVTPYTPPQEIESTQAKNLVPMSPPPQPTNLSSFSTSNSNSTAAKSQSDLKTNGSSMVHVSNNGNDTSVHSDAAGIKCCYTWLLFLTTFSIILAA